MKNNLKCVPRLLIAISALVMSLSSGRMLFAQRDAAAVQQQEGVEVQTRGPVHEAFAEVISFQPEPGVVVSKPPPEPIEEIPPDQKPEGTNVVWIPGYWAWDDDRDDFLWVSGVWRAIPPGRQWVPGYWTQEGNQYQWISGYWADAQTDSIDYLPEPPQTLEDGPSGDPPSANDIWIPGTWLWHQNRYAWRPGYWLPGQANWIWIPAHYVWTPRGYVFVDGYWDYGVNRRGLAFAPAYISAQAYGQPGFVYSPLIAINPLVFGSFLFLRPGYAHYYFGDFYAPSYAGAGFFPWFAFGPQYGAGYDPFFATAQWQNRDNRNWAANVQSQFEDRRDNENARPPRTFAEQQKMAASGSKAAAAMLVAAPIAALAKSKDLRLQPVSQQERQQVAKTSGKVREFGRERQQIEAKGEVSRHEPSRAKLPKSPTLAQGSERVPSHEAPPAAPRTPKPDLSATPPKPGERGKSEPGRSPLAPGARRPGGAGDQAKPGEKGRESTREPSRPGEKPGAKPGEPRPPAGKPEPKGKKPEPPPAPQKGGAPGPKPKAEPKPEPKPQPKPEPKPQPKAEPKPPPPPPAPKPAPKNEAPPPGKPKPEPKPEPKPKA
jgi:hypothetical protein